MSPKNPFVAFRLTSDEMAALDAFASIQKCSRSDAARTAIAYGLPLAQNGNTINILRLAMCIERMQAMLDMIIHREHPDAVSRLEEISRERVVTYHGSR